MIFLALVVRQFGNKKIENMFHIQSLNSNRNIQIIDTDFVSWGEKMRRNCEFHKGMMGGFVYMSNIFLAFLTLPLADTPFRYSGVSS